MRILAFASLCLTANVPALLPFKYSPSITISSWIFLSLFPYMITLSKAQKTCTDSLKDTQTLPSLRYYTLTICKALADALSFCI